MAGQTKREGPWESNLGLEPEWDGAFGLWKPADSEEWLYAGQLIHRGRECIIQLLEAPGQHNLLERSRRQPLLEDSIWHGSIQLPKQDKRVEITVLASIFPTAHTLQSRNYDRFDRIELYPSWIIVDTFIPNLEEAKWGRVTLEVNLLSHILPQIRSSRSPVDKFVARVDNNQINLFASLVYKEESKIHDINTKWKKGTDSLQFIFQQPLTIINDKDNLEDSNTLFYWLDKTISLLELIAQTPASHTQIFVENDNSDKCQLYIQLPLAKKYVVVQTHSFYLNQRWDIDKNKWCNLINKWFEIMRGEGFWHEAYGYLRHALRLSPEYINIEDYFLPIIRIFEARYNAEFPNPEDEILKKIKYLLRKSSCIRPIQKKAKLTSSFDANHVAGITRTIRNELEHPGTQLDSKEISEKRSKERTRIRKYLKLTSFQPILPLAWFLYYSMLELFRREEIGNLLNIRTPGNGKPEFRFHDPIVLLNRLWPELYNEFKGPET